MRHYYVLTAAVIALLISTPSLSSQTPIDVRTLIRNDTLFLEVNSTDDTGDPDPRDTLIPSPITLRTALQTSLWWGLSTVITFHGSINDDTIHIQSPIPAITKPCVFLGKGITLHGPGVVTGLNFDFRTDGSYIEDVFLYGFDGPGLVLHGDNCTISSVESHDNNGPGIVLNDADNNTFKAAPAQTTYASLLVYNNKGASGSGMQIDAESEGNIIDGGFFGLTNSERDVGNERDGLLIQGAGTVVKGCVFAFNETNGILIDMDSTNGDSVIIDSCRFQVGLFGNGLGSIDNDNVQERGVYGFQAYNVRVSNCIFGSHTQTALSMSGVECRNVLVRDNTVGVLTGSSPEALPVGGRGVELGGDNMTATNNVIGATRTGMSALGSDIVISGNRIGVVLTDSTYAAPQFSGITLGELTNCIIGDSTDASRGNVIIGAGSNGISSFSTTPVQNVLIANNVIGPVGGDGRPHPVGRAGISVGGEVQDWVVRDNWILAEQLGLEIRKRIVVRQDGPVWFIPKEVLIKNNVIGGIELPRDSVMQDSVGILVDYGEGIDIDSNKVQNSEIGIAVRSDSSLRVRITRNIIGEPAVGDTNYSNKSFGILLEHGAQNVAVGDITDSTSGNNISGNAGVGIQVRDSARFNTIVYNAVSGNDSGAIALGNGAAYYTTGAWSDSLDADVGPNQLQNVPSIDTVEFKTGSIRYTGKMRGIPGEILRVDCYTTIPFFDSLFNAVLDSLPELLPLIAWVETFQVTVGQDGIATFNREITDSNKLKLFVNLGPVYPIVTATNQSLSTSQASPFTIKASNDTVAVDLVAEYTEESIHAGGGQVRVEMRAYTRTPTPVRNVVLRDTVPASFIVDSVTTSHGSAEVEGDQIVVRLDVLESMDTVYVQSYGRETMTGEHVRRLGARSIVPDPDTTNNKDTIIIDVPVVNSVSEADPTPTSITAGQRIVRVVSDGVVQRATIYDAYGRELMTAEGRGRSELTLETAPGVRAVVVQLTSRLVVRNVVYVSP